MPILLVDDDPDGADLLQNSFERRGYACLVASSIEEANWMLTAASPRAIVVSLELNGASALAWLQALAVLRPELARRTLVLTGRTPTTQEAIRVAACGARTLFRRIGPDELVDAVLATVASLRHGSGPGDPVPPGAWHGPERRRYPRSRRNA